MNPSLGGAPFRRQRRVSARLVLLSLLLCVLVAVSTGCKDAAVATEEPVASNTHPKYRAGQIWAVHTPAGQPDARLTVLRVDSHPRLGIVVHIALAGIELPDGSRTVNHMPFTEQALNSSVTKLIKENQPLPEYRINYVRWRTAVEAGRGGAFSVPLAEAFETLKEAHAGTPSG